MRALTPCSKKCYTRRDAGYALNHWPRGTKRKPCRVYWCRTCDAWHLTSEPKRKEKQNG